MKVSRFTPSLMKHQDLEEIFVQRHKLAQNIVELIRNSVITPSKHHMLLVGPRGIGKTHLVSLVYYRIREMDDLGDRLLIAWLREEEWGITSFLDLLLRIFRALQEEYGTPPSPPLAKGGGEVDSLLSPLNKGGGEVDSFSLLPPLNKGGLGGLSERVEALYQLPPDAAERAGAKLLKEVIGNCTLLLLMENLDEVFAGLGDEGQKRLRAFLQENACCTILATSQSLFNGVKLQTSPFYGFFRIHHLEDLTSEDATQLLANIARLEGDRELESFIQMPTGRDRIRAVHHLAGGSHRVYVIFSEFLTRESLDELVEPFMRMLDDLTPYYQARMQWLSPQQRKIIEFLCDRRHPVPVKEIAQRCFMTHQTASGQLKDLREKGYVTSEAIGRESFYELREVLMRFCLEVKKQRGETIQLFVDFLRLWYSKQELQERLDRLSSAEMLQAPSLEREYVLQALKAISHDSLQQHSKNIDTNATVEASDEDIVELDNALNRLAEEPGKEASAEDVELIFRNLFNNTHDAAIWKTRITTLIQLYNKHQVISALGQGLVRSIPALMSEMVSDKAAQTWLEVWQELTSDYTQFQIPLRLLNTAVRYRETKGDKRVLLELPIEERNLLKPLLGISEGGQ